LISFAFTKKRLIISLDRNIYFTNLLKILGNGSIHVNALDTGNMYP